MKIKTSDLSGVQLDWAVAKCELLLGQDYTLSIDHDGFVNRVNFGGMYPEWSSDWAEGGPIIEREQIALFLNGDDEWTAEDGWHRARGETPLVAAMRCYVANKLGDEVEIPEELKETANA